MFKITPQRRPRFVAVLLAAALLAPGCGALPALAQATQPAATSTIPRGIAVTLQATIKKIDRASREMTLEAPNGATVTVVAGPAVRLSLLQAGDVVTAQYYRSVAFVISTSSQPVPPDQMAAMLARPAQAPGGIAVKEVRISGTIVGIDLSAYTVQVIPPGGGRVVTLEVTDPVRRSYLSKLKVGETVTAIISEALVVSVAPKS